MYLLIYSYDDKKTGRVKLISGFPVDQQTFEKSTDASQLGDGRVISLRYNAWINGISDTSDLLKGSRLLIP